MGVVGATLFVDVEVEAESLEELEKERIDEVSEGEKHFLSFLLDIIIIDHRTKLQGYKQKCAGKENKKDRKSNQTKGRKPMIETWNLSVKLTRQQIESRLGMPSEELMLFLMTWKRLLNCWSCFLGCIVSPSTRYSCHSSHRRVEMTEKISKHSFLIL